MRLPSKWDRVSRGFWENQLPITNREWTHTSVLAFAGDRDPADAMLHRARGVVIDAMDIGWTGPPFDAIALADNLGVTVVPRDDFGEARSVSVAAGKVEMNCSLPDTNGLSR
jgi:hypothetical protein